MPASCSDPECEADHGYTGTSTADDLSVRVSAEGDGAEAVLRALEFARALSAATARTCGSASPGRGGVSGLAQQCRKNQHLLPDSMHRFRLN
jgi:hypothetical protein